MSANATDAESDDCGSMHESESSDGDIRASLHTILPVPVPIDPPVYRLHHCMDGSDYIARCGQHVKAEYWAAFQEKTSPPLDDGWRERRCDGIFLVETRRIVPTVGEALKVCDAAGAPHVAVDVGSSSSDESESAIDATDKCYEVEIFSAKQKTPREGWRPVQDLVESFKGQLCIWRENLFLANEVCLSCGCKPSPLLRNRCHKHTTTTVTVTIRMRKLRSMSDLPDKACAKNPLREKLLYTLGNCSDTVNLLTVFNAFQRALEEPVQGGTSSKGKLETDAEVLSLLANPCLSAETVADYRNPIAEEKAAAAAATAAAPEQVLNDAVDIDLCAEQRGILQGLSRRLEFIQGPPGTGKSTAIRAIVRNHLPLGENSIVLIVAVQNKAIDVLVRMFAPFVDNDVAISATKMLVVGSAFNPNMGETSKLFTIEALMSSNGTFRAAFETFIAALDKCSRSISPAEEKMNALEVDRLYAELELAAAKTRATILQNSRILFSTCTEVRRFLLSPTFRKLRHRITTVIVDEAGTVPEFQMPVIAGLLNVERIICIGDVNQLPPFSHLQRAAPEGFMQRVQSQLQRVPMLTVQFRMHRDIATFVSGAFYRGALTTDPTTALARRPEFRPNCLFLEGICWINVHNRRNGTAAEIATVTKNAKEAHRLQTRICQNDGNPAGEGSCELPLRKSFANYFELAHIIRALELFVQYRFFDTSPPKTVAVITFYKAQAQELCVALQSSRFSQVFAAAQAASLLRVQTVDSAQGGEADIVILSCTRSNPACDVGFLSNAKRLCVAASRAKEALMIVGDKQCMESSVPAFKLLLNLPVRSGNSGGQPAARWSNSLTVPVRVLSCPEDLADAVNAASRRAAELREIAEMFAEEPMAQPLPGAPGDAALAAGGRVPRAANRGLTELERRRLQEAEEM